jgi:hypothetical protein
MKVSYFKCQTVSLDIFYLLYCTAVQLL